MNREIIITGDGSPTIFVPELDEHYHSVHGALNESLHVFIQAGLSYRLEQKKTIHILEIGLGTGSNLLLTLDFIQSLPVQITYDALEPFPITNEIINSLGSSITTFKCSKETFEQIHNAEAGQPVTLSPKLSFTRLQETLQNVQLSKQYDLIYFDAFGPRAQPEMWEAANFDKLFRNMEPGGVLVTYCAKGSVRRTLQEIGFMVEKLPGPPGKREMLRATKLPVNFVL